MPVLAVALSSHEEWKEKLGAHKQESKKDVKPRKIVVKKSCTK